MYIYHKQSEIMQKIQWNSPNGQLHWFPIDFLWKWSIMDQNNANAFFKRYPGMPYESWCPAVSENMVFFYAIIFKPELLLLKVWSNLRNFFWQSGVVTNLNTCSILSFILPYSIRVDPIGMFLGWLNGRTWKGKL